jgi:integrase
MTMATISKYQTASGTTLYRVRYRTPDNRQTDKRGFETKREAQIFAASVEVAKARGEYVAVSTGRTTIGELGPRWLERQRGHMRPSGFRAYESGWRVHIAPRWANVKIADVKFSDVQSWVADLAADRGPSIVRTAYSVLARILDDCVRDRMLAVNPARGVKLPPKSSPKHIYLTAEQLKHLADESGQYRSLVYLLGLGGCRWGEAAAIRVSDVNFLRHRIHLQRNAVMVGARVIIGPLKSHRNRTVALPGFVIDAIAATCAGKNRDGLIWSTAAGTPLGPPAPSTSWLAYAVARCQKTDPSFPRITAHALRHTAVSLAISAGANPKVVQRMLGHASAAMTLDVYADLFESDLDAVAESVGKMWARPAISH